MPLSSFFVIGFTGHVNIEKAQGRPLPKNGEEYDRKALLEVYIAVDELIERVLSVKYDELETKKLALVSGMARGFDEAVALYAMKNDLPLILAVPGSILWHKNRGYSRGVRAQAIYYDEILDYVRKKERELNTKLIYEIDKNYGGKKEIFVNMARNSFIVDVSDVVVSFKKTDSSGTNDAIEKAIAAGKYFGNIVSYENLPKAGLPFIVKYDTDLFEERSHVLIHGANCFCVMGAGIAKEIKKRFPQAFEADLRTKKGDETKLGNFSYAKTGLKNPLYVVNAYTQFEPGANFEPKFLQESLEKIVDFFLKKRKSPSKRVVFALPPIGLGIGGGKVENFVEILEKVGKKFEKENAVIKICVHEKDERLKKEIARRCEEIFKKNRSGP